MAFRFRSAAAVATLALLTVPAIARDRASYNRSMDTMHQPVVSRTDMVIDLNAGPQGLAGGEPQRLAGWFDGLVLGYADTVYVDDTAAGIRADDAVGQVLSRYGMLVSHQPLPATIEHPQSGRVRVIVSRAVARVEGCPDWSRGNYPDYEQALISNYGCASAQNLAAMIANPQDLVQGVDAGPASDARLSVKAVATWRDAKQTGGGGITLKSESTKSGGN